MNAIERAHRVRDLARELAALLVGPDEDVAHFETRAVVGDLLDAVGVRSVATWPDGSREWAFDEGFVEETAVTTDPDNILDRIDGAAVAYSEAIQAVDPSDEEAATAVRLSLRGVLDDARVRVPETWQAAVLHELGAVIRGPLRSGTFRVTEGTVDVQVRGNTLTARLAWNPVVEFRWPTPPGR